MTGGRTLTAHSFSLSSPPSDCASASVPVPLPAWSSLTGFLFLTRSFSSSMMSKMLCTLMFPLLAAMIRSSSARASGVISPVIVRPGTRTDAPLVVSPREEA